MDEDVLLQELEERLEENRRLVEETYIPKPLYGVASYLGFHTFRVLVGLSFGLTVIGFYFFYDQLVLLGKQLFLFL